MIGLSYNHAIEFQLYNIYSNILTAQMCFNQAWVQMIVICLRITMCSESPERSTVIVVSGVDQRRRYL